MSDKWHWDMLKRVHWAKWRNADIVHSFLTFCVMAAVVKIYMYKLCVHVHRGLQAECQTVIAVMWRLFHATWKDSRQLPFSACRVVISSPLVSQVSHGCLQLLHCFYTVTSTSWQILSFITPNGCTEKKIQLYTQNTKIHSQNRT